MGHPQIGKRTRQAQPVVSFLCLLPHDLADLGVAGSLRLVGVDVHGGDGVMMT